MTERLLGDGSLLAVPQIIIRGTVISDTTRCDIYPWGKISNLIESPHLPFPPHQGFYLDCFVDVRINEYLVGVGPPQLTVLIETTSFGLLDPDGWEEITDEWIDFTFDNPDSRVASAFEGRELVLFLDAPDSLVMEVWHVQRGTPLWFVQRHGDEVRAVSEHLPWARTDQHRSKLNMSLSELTAEIKQAAQDRIAITGGRIGKDPTLPMLVTDANKLRDFFGAVGAVYDGDDATILPPPLPGEDGPVQDPATTDEEAETEGEPTGPGEDTTTSTTDETTTTTTDTTTSTTDETTTTTTTMPTTTTTESPSTTTTTDATTTTTTAPSTTTTTTPTTAVTTGPTTTPSTTTPEASAPGAVRRFTLEAGNGNVTATWRAPRSDGGSVITGYELAYRERGTSTRATKVTAAGSDRSKTITPLTAGVTYQIRIRAINAEGNGRWTRWKDATPQEPPTTTSSATTTPTSTA